MTRVTIHTTDGGDVEVQDMPDDDVMLMVEAVTGAAYEAPDWIGVTLDDAAITHIAVAHIVRVDVG